MVRMIVFLSAVWGAFTFPAHSRGSAESLLETARNANRATFSSDGKKLLVDLSGGAFEIDLESQTIASLAGGQGVYDAIYADDLIIGCFVSQQDRDRILGTDEKLVDNPRGYSGIVVLKEGKELSRFTTVGNCWSPQYDHRNKRVYYARAVFPPSEESKESYLSYDIFSNNLQGTDERRETVANRTIYEMFLADNEGKIYYTAMTDKSNMNFRYRFGLVTPEQLGRDYDPGMLVLSLFSVEPMSGAVSVPVSSQRNFEDGEVSFLANSMDQSILGIRRIGGWSAHGGFEILSMRKDGSAAIVGHINSEKLPSLARKIRILSLDPQRQRMVFAQERPMSQAGRPIERWFFLVNFDGSGLTELVINQTKMTVKLVQR